MPTPLPFDAPPTTLADAYLYLHRKGLPLTNRTKTYKDGKETSLFQHTNTSLEGQDWLVFQDNSCVPAFQDKPGHVACAMGPGTVGWYPLGPLTEAPWIAQTKTPENGDAFSLLKTLQPSLFSLLRGIGKRVTVCLFVTNPRRDAQSRIGVRINGSTLDPAPLEAAIAQKLATTPTTAYYKAVTGWVPGMPLVTGHELGTLSFSMDLAPPSAHRILTQIEAFLDA